MKKKSKAFIYLFFFISFHFPTKFFFLSLVLYDVFQSKKAEEDFDLFSIEDVDAVFEANRFTQLKYAQRVPLMLSVRRRREKKINKIKQ